MGKTAYYDPNTKTIVLYTEGRHPKDIVRSFSHEMIHHIQNLEDRLGDIGGTNTMEDDHLNDIEAEANLKGTMTFRNWTDSINENIFKKSLDQTKKYTLKTGETITLKVDKFMLSYDSLNITAFDKDDNKIGAAYFTSDETNNPKILSSSDTSVKPNWWRKGVGTAIYDFAKTFKYKILPSKEQTPDGKKFTDSLNEAIVGEKIECDNCDWSWKIVDGGDDLFICHKCGHDNTPLNEIQTPANEKDVDPKELAMGIEVEMEHTDDKAKAKIIALQHLAEDPKYYTKLKSLDLEEKKNKDPFGLNQYARELAMGLEEAIMNEGRYDTLANKLSSIAFEAFKDIHDRGDSEGEFEFKVDHPDDEHDIPSKDFYFDFLGKVEITDGEYEVDGGANAGFDDEGESITPMLSVKFKIPKNPKWSTISMDLKDVVRHELEHLTQDGDNEKTGKYMEDDKLVRDLIDADMLSKSQYFKLEKEVDAMLQGLYFKAKKSKRPFGDVIDDYLNIFLDQDTITQEEKNDILNTWRSRRKALSLPIFEQENIENMENKYKIYLDMDGVITDFDKRFTDLAGMGPREYESSFGKDKFWDFIDSKEKGGGVGFWVGMPWMPGGPELYNRVSQHDHALLSSPSRSESSRIGKHQWKKKYTPSSKLILALARNKQNYADGNNILIDDRESNIQQWREAGGIGILYKSADQVNKELDKLGL
jgi:hypothetical protein